VFEKPLLTRQSRNQQGVLTVLWPCAYTAHRGARLRLRWRDGDTTADEKYAREPWTVCWVAFDLDRDAPGTLWPKLCYAKGMTHYLYAHDIRIFDYARFAEPRMDEIRAKAQAVAAGQGLEIEYIRKKDFRKEDRIQAILAQRGSQPGLVHIFSAMEPCATYNPGTTKRRGTPTLSPTVANVCITTSTSSTPSGVMLPARANLVSFSPYSSTATGTPGLACQLSQQQIAHCVLDNAFGQISDYAQANQFRGPVGLRTGCAASWTPGPSQYCRLPTPCT